jgi:DNA-binding NtrC family response regulator
MYRLSVIRVELPPLRERRADIAPLTEHFLKLFASRYCLPHRPLRADCWDWLMTYAWPGNVRELESMLHRAVLLAEGEEVVLDEVRMGREPPQAAAQGGRLGDTAPRERGIAHARSFPDFQSAKAHAIADFERRYVSELLERTDGNITAAARLAHKERRAFGRLVKKLGIMRDDL